MVSKWMMALVLALTLAAAPASADDGTTHEGGESAPLALTVAKSNQAGAADDQRARAYFTDLPVVSHEGQVLRFYSDVLKDRVVLINFVYTNCKGACPLVTQKLKQVQKSLGERFGSEVFFVSISIDPDRDTPAALREFARQQNADQPGWFFLTGDKPNVERIVKKLGQYNGEVGAHSTLMIVGNVRTRHWAKIPPTATPAQISLKLETLTSES